MLSRLSDLLRYALETEHEPFVRVATELDFVQQYLEIQQVRFRDRLEVHVEVEPGTEDLSIPSMLLQPLVENAVLHGMGGLRQGVPEGKNTVRVSVRRQRDELEVCVSNPARAEEQRPSGFGIGLQNVRDRVERLYGDHADFGLHHEDGLVVARLRVPAERIGVRGNPGSTSGTIANGAKSTEERASS